jgi:chemotaxis protein methyltransferase CheR
MTLPLSPPVFAILSALIAERLGIHYEERERDLLAAKVSPRALEAGFESLLDYYYYLRYDEGGPAELDVLTEHLVVRETYLFRELEPLEVLVRRVLVPLAQREPQLRLWCAASATGEEPLTLAMLLASAGLLSRTHLLATDISPRGLEKARRGLFGGRSLRRDDIPAFAVPYLRRMGDEQLAVDPALPQAIQWERQNLLHRESVRARGPFHAVLCRNVLIYFSEETSRRVVDDLVSTLVPGGQLLVGVSESLLRLGTALACSERDGAFFYEKVAA